MSFTAQNARLPLAVSLAVLLAISLSGCITTGPGEPEPWDPDERAQAHVNLAMNYLRRNQFEVARRELELALSIQPKSDSAYHGKGLIMAETGHAEDAKKFLAKAVSLNPENFGAANDYGIYLCQNGDTSGGTGVLQGILDHPDNEPKTNTWLGLALCHFRDGERAIAAGYFRQVLDDAPRLPQALLPMAEIAYDNANYLSARAFVERYISTGTISERALVLGANTELQLNDRDRAIQYAQELRRRYPQSASLAGFRSLLKGG